MQTQTHTYTHTDRVLVNVHVQLYVQCRLRDRGSSYATSETTYTRRNQTLQIADTTLKYAIII